MECDAPLSIKLNPPRPDGKGGLIYYFPAGCGKCLPCLMRRKAQWSFRIQAEARNAFSSYFVTLTYDDKHVPIGDYQLSGNKLDHKLFIQNLKKLETQKVLSTRKLGSSEELRRKLLFIPEDEKFRYYGVIEYGDRFQRPHLHYIIFNIVDRSNIGRAWNRGISQVDECNVNTIDYVLKYMLKHVDKKDDERQREVSFMSKGIGMVAADDPNFVRHIERINANSVVNTRGQEIGLPRYYRKKLLTDKQREEKNRYISDLLEKQSYEFEMRNVRRGKNPDTVRMHAKTARFIELKRNQNRNLNEGRNRNT